jgi:hypothetical protein
MRTQQDFFLLSLFAAAGFGQLSQDAFACAAYRTSAPVTITAIYK